MTITYKGEDPLGRSAQNLKGVRTYTRAFLFTADAEEDAWDVGSHPNAPVIGSAYRDAWCISSSPACVSGRDGWKITAQYSSEIQLNEDPTQDAAKVRVYTEQFQKVLQTDINGNSVCNSAGDPFDPPIMVDDSRRVITVQKNMATHPSWILSYQDAVNSDSFTVKGQTYAAGKGKVQRVDIGDEQSRNSITYYVVSFEIHLQKNGWIVSQLDAGFRELQAGSGSGVGSLVNIVNPGDGLQPSAPVPLGGNGVSLANPSFTNNVFLNFTAYEQLPFSVLPFT